MSYESTCAPYTTPTRSCIGIPKPLRIAMCRTQAPKRSQPQLGTHKVGNLTKLANWPPQNAKNEKNVAGLQGLGCCQPKRSAWQAWGAARTGSQHKGADTAVMLAQTICKSAALSACYQIAWSMLVHKIIVYCFY